MLHTFLQHNGTDRAHTLRSIAGHASEHHECDPDNQGEDACDAPVWCGCQISQEHCIIPDLLREDAYGVRA